MLINERYENTLKRDISRLEKNKGQLTQTVQALVTERRNLQSNIEEHEGEIFVLKEDLMALEAQRTGVANEIKALQIDVSGLQIQKLNDARTSELESNLTDAKQTIQQLESELATRTVDLTTTQNRLKSSLQLT